MKSSKHEAKKRDIIDSAFRTWGKTRFQNTSLSELASVHGITKQALYRYFSSKEKLEQAMEKTALSVYNTYADQMIDDLESAEESRFVELYLEESVAFLKKNHQTMSFLAYRYRQSDLGQMTTREGAKRIAELAMKKVGIPDVGMRYLNALAFMEIHCRNPKPERQEAWKTAWSEGFAGGLDQLPDFERLNRDAGRIDYSVFGEDPVVRAVFETVMEEAGQDVSLGKVARKAGLTKSSLYNYWPSKEAMLNGVLAQQITTFSELFADYSRRYTEPQNRLFAYVAFTANFFLRTPEVLNYMQRMMSFGVVMPKNGPESGHVFLAPLLELVDSGVLNLHHYEAVELLGLVNLAGVNEIKHHLAEGSVRIRVEQCLKDLYLLVTGGISTIRRKKS